MRPHILAVALAVALPVRVAAAQTSVGPAGAPRPASALPDSPLGRLGQRLLDVVEAGDSATVARFVAEHLGRDVRGRSPEKMAGMLVKLHAQSGGLRVERAMMAGSALRMITKAKSAEKMLGIELEPAVGDSARIAAITLVQLDPATMSGPPQPWATGSLSDARIAEVIRAKVKDAADADRFSGAVIVGHGDHLLVFDNHGFADREAKRPITNTTPFATYSMGKMFTAVAIAQLVSNGKLGWDDTLAKVLPSYPNRDAAGRVTIRQLLTHTAGVPDVFLSKRFDMSKNYASHLAMLPDFADAPLNANHGKSFDYSNGNFAVLAAVVEQLSGLTYEQYLARHVFGPAGMTLPTEKSAIGYARFTELDPLGVEPRRPETVRGAGTSSAKPRAVGYGGGAYTAEDLYRFARALRTGKLVPQAIADSIVKGEVTMGGRTKYALGFFDRAMNGKRVVGHSGSNPDTGHDADLQMVWDDQWTVVVLSNYDAPAGMMIEMPILELITRSATTAQP
ncbi:MAG TPA: serine hydrolase domain-containing protein [Gemmatimonadaceae bacterium]|nr:serine hydrolase domain-containing protein [Gemmatimonadaceae bacterium]